MIIKIEMHFLPNVFVPCEVCTDVIAIVKRPSVHYKEKYRRSAGLLTVPIRQLNSSSTFKNWTQAQDHQDVGPRLCNTLGQPATTLSDWKRSRWSWLLVHKPLQGKSLYLGWTNDRTPLPKTFLSAVKILERFVDDGNTVPCGEHNLDVIKTTEPYHRFRTRRRCRWRNYCDRNTRSSNKSCPNYTQDILKITMNQRISNLKETKWKPKPQSSDELTIWKMFVLTNFWGSNGTALVTERGPLYRFALHHPCQYDLFPLVRLAEPRWWVDCSCGGR